MLSTYPLLRRLPWLKLIDLDFHSLSSCWASELGKKKKKTTRSELKRVLEGTIKSVFRACFTNQVARYMSNKNRVDTVDVANWTISPDRNTYNESMGPVPNAQVMDEVYVRSLL